MYVFFVYFAEYQYKLNEKFSIKPSFRIEFVDKEINFDISKIDSSWETISKTRFAVSSNFKIINGC